MSNKLQGIFSAENKWPILVIVVGTIAWSLTMVRSGLCWGGSCSNGIGFWGPNGHDGIWHITMIKSLARGSWEMPIFAGFPIRNYHIGYDFLISMMHKLTLVDVSTLQFQIIPVVLAILLGIFVHLFVKEWTKSSAASAWTLFFIYFGGSLGWLVNLLRGGSIDGESVFWAQQSVSTLINPPFAMSLMVMFVALWLMQKSIGGKSKKYLLVATFLFGLLIQIKVYAGVLALLSLLASGLYLIYKKRNFTVFRVFAGALLISLIIFLPMNWGSSSVIEWKPFWFVQTLFEFSDRFNWPRMASAIANYRLGGQWLKYLAAVSVGSVVFIIGNFGTRALSIFYGLKRFRKLDYLDVFIFSVIAAGIVAPMFFVQKGTVWNTIQFLYYSLIFSGVLAGIWLSGWLSDLKFNVLKYLFAGLIVALTIPTTLATLRFHYLPNRPPARLSTQELEALEFLSTQADGVVLVQPFDAQAALEAQSHPPRPLYLYESSAYVSAYSNKPLFMEDEVNLNITGYNWSTRRAETEKFFEFNDMEFLTKNNINYLYLLKEKEETVHMFELKNIFENDEVVIFKV
ncbi:hypothetical protein ACFL2C_00785 [Patescibacteria group bacterium]